MQTKPMPRPSQHLFRRSHQARHDLDNNSVPRIIGMKESRTTYTRNKRVDSAVWRYGRCIRFGYQDNGDHIRLWGRKALPRTQRLLRRDRLTLLQQRLDIGLDIFEPSGALRASLTSAALLFRLAVQLRLKERSLERRVIASVHRSKKDSTANDERRWTGQRLSTVQTKTNINNTSRSDCRSVTSRSTSFFSSHSNKDIPSCSALPD
jgi:hypothetical protein